MSINSLSDNDATCSSDTSFSDNDVSPTKKQANEAKLYSIDCCLNGLQTDDNEKFSHSRLTQDDKDNDIRFSPPVYLQRYRCAIERILRYEKYIDKIVDFGCSEMRFLQLLKSNVKKPRQLYGVDIDKNVLNDNLQRVAPLPYDYLDKRQAPLIIKILNGSIFDFDARLADCDAVTCIEVIEHIPREKLDDIAEAVLGRLKPFIWIVTTPNADFNVLFGLKSGQFRHYDHKYELSREEFISWCGQQTKRFRTYWVRFEGVGNDPNGSNSLGQCSQIAIFRRTKDSYFADRRERIAHRKKQEIVPQNLPYQELASYVYPTLSDVLDKEHRIECLANSICSELSLTEEYSVHKGVMKIPLDRLFQNKRMQRLCPDTADLG